MRRAIVFAVVVAALLVAAGVYAQSVWLSSVRPVFASADLTCYPVERGFDLASVASRKDVLATFTRRDAQARLEQVCFLRVPTAAPYWAVEP
jgi:hypothetical protein